MREFQQSSLGLAGSLLIAHPNLLDPNFRRTVLYIAVHDFVDGSLGLILNRPTNRTVDEVVEGGDLGNLAKIPVFFGGPVGRDRLTFASFRWVPELQSLECNVNLGLDEAQRASSEPGAVLRAFVGYSGWSGGQLEGELEQKAWVVQTPDRTLLDPDACTQIWFSIMQDYGPWFRLLATAPDDPSKN